MADNTSQSFGAQGSAEHLPLPEGKKTLFFYNPAGSVGADGFLHYRVSPSGLSETGAAGVRDECFNLLCRSDALAEIIEDYGNLVALEIGIKDGEICSVTPPPKKKVTATLPKPDGSAGGVAVDIEGAVKPLGTYLRHQCVREGTNRAISVLATPAGTPTEAVLHECQVKEYLQVQLAKPELRELTRDISPESMDTFFEEHTRGRSVMDLLSGKLSEPIKITVDGAEKTITNLGINMRGKVTDLPASILAQAKTNPELAKQILLTHSVGRMIMEGRMVQGGLEQKLEKGEIPDSLRFLRELEHTNVSDPMPRGSHIIPVAVNAHGQRKGYESGFSLFADDPEKLIPAHLGRTRDYTEESFLNLVNTAQLFAGAQFAETIGGKTVILDKHSFETPDGQKQLMAAGLVGARQIKAYNAAKEKLGKEPDFAEVLTAQQANVSTDVSNALSELRDKMAGILSKAEFGKDPDLKLVVGAIAGFCALISSGITDIIKDHEGIELLNPGKGSW